MDKLFRKTFLKKESIAQGAIRTLFAGGKKRCDKQKFVTIAKPCFAHSRNYSIAQGTIEYLIIVGVIVVLSLVIVALIVNLSSAPSQQILSESEKLGGLGGGGIVIVEAVSDFNESGFVVLRNYSGGDLSLTKIKVDGNSYDYSNEFIGSTKEEIFNIKDLCVCKSGETRRTCEFEFFYLTQSGLEKKESKNVTVNCVSGVSVDGGSGGSGGKVVEPIFPEPNGGTPPTVVLFSPFYSNNKSVDFEFEVDAEKDISSCTLFVGDDSNTYYNISDGSNTINYTFLTDKLVDYNISCVDNSNNVGYSDSLTINVDSNSFQITTCVELQDMNKNLGGHYELMNNIDCAKTSAWSPYTMEWICIDGECYENLTWYTGFMPIGSSSSPFTGSFNGNNFIINNLYINRWDSYVSNYQYVGLFGYVFENSLIQNVGLMDHNIVGYEYVGALVGYNKGSIFNSYSNGITVGASSYSGAYLGGLVGMNEGGSVTYCHTLGVTSGHQVVSDTLVRTGHVGGLIGYNWGSSVVLFNYVEGEVIGNQYVGGVIGYNAVSIPNDYVTNNYSSADVDGYFYVGGIIGCNSGHVLNNYNVGNIKGRDTTGGLIGYNSSGNVLNNYNSGEVSGIKHTGGLIGYNLNNHSFIQNNYVSGSVIVDGNFAGGLIGYLKGGYIKINNNFVVGQVISNSGYFHNGLLGKSIINLSSLNYFDNYWDISLTGKNNCYTNKDDLDVNTNCISTNNNPEHYYSQNNAPLSSWTWGEDGNWIAVAGNYPKLSWQD